MPLVPFLSMLSLSHLLLLLSPRAVVARSALTSSFLYDEWRPEEIGDLLAQLTPRRMLLTHMSPVHATSATKRCPFYGTAYAEGALDDALIAACERPPKIDTLCWPEPNPFIPREFGLACDDDEEEGAAPADVSDGAAPGAAAPKNATAPPSSAKPPSATYTAALAARGALPPPTRVCDDGTCEVWHKIDRTFRRPKTNLYLDVVSPAAYVTAGAAMLTGVSIRLVADELTEFAYPAEIAGLTYSVRRHTTGFYVIAEG